MSGKRFKSKRDNRKLKSKSTSKIMILMLIAIATIAAIIAISMQAYAYLIHKDSVENDMVLGYNKIALQENFEPPLTMDKGISFKKEPYVTNTGNVDCYVRVKSVISDSRVADGITINYNTEDYTYNAEDGYWYYNQAISPGQETSKLFTTVTISDEADDRVLDGFDIYVYAESVQTIEGKTMQETWNYFE